ncbi:uncharacterized protein BO96DRAFT_413598 [Aspergillus niger CBS 101883]|uniref:uncharacterized protein n=1 Tax=Aspergillus lacticoffeatus (strain CBS 101883) TaxID=1450533 RepID=UPI000D7F01BC|nr:uncharacterized protein BO96DRAFT_413598 [Aspergillus niger CBS 101883]PYH54937.1 hypothetical protein BO96DRAFT_413598 [Aspergillus niger CBS 101883]
MMEVIVCPRLLEAASIINPSDNSCFLFAGPGPVPSPSIPETWAICSATLAGRIPGMSDIPSPFGLVGL